MADRLVRFIGVVAKESKMQRGFLNRIALSLLVLACFATAASAQRSLTETLFKSGSEAYEKGKYAEALRMFSQCVESGGTTPAEQVAIQLNIAESLRSLGRFKESEETFKKTLKLMDSLPPKQRSYSTIFNDMALVYQSLGRFSEAEGLWKQSEQSSKKGSLQLVYPVNGLARHYGLWGKLKEQQEYVAKAEVLAKRLPKTLALPYWLLNAGKLYEQQGQYKDAEKAYRRAMETCSAQRGSTHYYNGLVLLDLSELYRKECRFADAENSLRQAEKIFASQFSDVHPDLLETRIKLGRVWCEQGRYSEARRLVESTLKTEETVFGGEANCYVARAQDCMGTIYRQDGRYEDAQNILQKALSNFQQVLGLNHLEVATTMRHLAYVQEDQANFSQAENLLLDSQKIVREQTGEEHPARAEAAAALAHLYLRQDKFAEAEPLLKSALELSERTLGTNHTVTAHGAHDLGDLYYKQKKFSDAQQYLEKALAIDEALFGPKAPQVAGDLMSLAAVFGAQGNTEKAEPLLQRVAEIKNVLPGGRVDNSASLVALKAAGADRPVGDKYALVIGISNFKDSSINLKYAAKDATDLRNFLVNHANFKSDHVKLLTDEQATRENVIGLLGEKWLGKRAKRDDLVLVYVSSHGSSARDDAGGTNFLVVHDTNKNSLLATGIPMQWLTKIIGEQVNSDRVVLILDVCHSGSAEGQKGLERAPGIDPTTVKVGRGQMLMCSCLADQVAWESKNYENSVFTRRLIEALQDGGDKSTLIETYKKLKVAVESEVLRDRGNLQTPLLVNKEWVGSDVALTVKPAP